MMSQIDYAYVVSKIVVKAFEEYGMVQLRPEIN
jgi:hypothetical protein